ncbi:MAG: hypothetical protein QOE97_2325 [Pseudonocardiales bacterium]|jgi:hypothetical protein|nr:hypothetical protein [Pseudonocardiales bacterium]
MQDLPEDHDAITDLVLTGDPVLERHGRARNPGAVDTHAMARGMSDAVSQGVCRPSREPCDLELEPLAHPVCSVGRMSSSFTATWRGRVTM